MLLLVCLDSPHLPPSHFRSDEEKFLWVEAISAVLGVANSSGLGGVETAPITDFDSHEIAQRLGSPTWDSGNFIKDDDGSEWNDAGFESGGSGRKRRSCVRKKRQREGGREGGREGEKEGETDAERQATRQKQPGSLQIQTTHQISTTPGSETINALMRDSYDLTHKFVSLCIPDNKGEMKISPVFRQGWIEKKGGFRSGKVQLSKEDWKKRWFVLAPDALLYYRSEVDAERGRQPIGRMQWVLWQL